MPAKRPRGGLYYEYDEMPAHPGPGATKMGYVWVQAVAHGLEDYAKEWLRLRGDVNATGWLTYEAGPQTGEEWDTGTTMLIAACQTGRGSLVELLLSHGAAVNKQDFNGETALHKLLLRWEDEGPEDCRELSLSCMTDFAQARESNARTLTMIKRLLQAGADPSIRTHDLPMGQTALEALEFRMGWMKRSRSNVWPAAEQLLVARHAPFDDAAQQQAKTRAKVAGKPKTQLQGLLAIHAVLNRASFARDEDAWSHYGTSRQRYYEWKAQLNGGQPLLCDAMCPAKRPLET